MARWFQLSLSALTRRLALSGFCAALAGCAGSPPPAAPAPELPRTRAERSGYTETSSYADVVQFVDSLRALGAPLHVGSIGRTVEGREIPLVVASRPLVRSPEEARRLGRPVVYVQGNIHAGEVEGKEALQALLRDLSFAPGPNVLDSVVLVAVPIYNADGNERLGPQARNRSEQNGPALVGERPNAQGLDLNRDYIKAEAPETRASLAMFDAWRPDLFVDLHTTNGSYHGYALTYAPSLHPSANAYTRDVFLPELRRRVRARHSYETFDYGNFSQRYGADVDTDTTREGWYSYDHRPRFGTNYYGLRGGVSILGEAYSHDPFERRVKSTQAFVREILSLAAERGAELPTNGPAGEVALRGELTRRPYTGEVVMEELAAVDSGVVTEPGVPAGLRRTGRFRTLRIPVYDRFDATRAATPPAAGYLLGPDQAPVVELLRLHGVEVRPLQGAWTVRAQAFVIDSAVVAPRPFQGHREVRLEGRWRAVERTVPAGFFLVPTAQPLGRLATYLLEPESDDGLVTWSTPGDAEPWRRRLFDGALRPGAEYPVLRLLER